VEPQSIAYLLGLRQQFNLLGLTCALHLHQDLFLPSREVEAVEIFLHNECHQKINKSLANAIDEIKATFDLTKNVNLVVKSIEKFEVEAHDDCKFEQEDQDSTHQDNQDSIDKDFTLEQEDQDSTHQDNQDPIDKDFTLEQEDQDSTHLDYQNSTHYDDQDSLNIFPHSIQYESPIINYPQETSYKHPFQFICHSSSLHSFMVVQEN
jgi:hypothetical protein